jgi:glycosyltransferase involved in cell wall biosynthesis
MIGTKNTSLARDARPLVLVFIAFYDPFISGGERFAIELMKRLKERYRFVVLTSRADRNLPVMATLDGIEVIRLGIGHDWDKYLFPFLAPWRARKMQPAFVHGIIESFAATALAIFHFFHPSVPTLLDLQSGSLDAPRLQRFIPEWWFRWVHATPTMIHAISQSLADRARRYGAKRIEVIPNGVELVRFQTAARGAQKESQCIRSVGRLHVDKGYDVLIRAMPEVLRAIPGARLEIAGEGDQRVFLQGIIDSLQLSGCVKLIGALPYQEVPRFMANAEVFVCPSRAEGMGIVFIEAQAAGTVPVGTRVGGIPDIIEDRVSGRLVSPENSQEIAAALIDLLQHPEKNKEMVATAQSRLARFSWDCVSAAVEKMYESLQEQTK